MAEFVVLGALLLGGAVIASKNSGVSTPASGSTQKPATSGKLPAPSEGKPLDSQNRDRKSCPQCAKPKNEPVPNKGRKFGPADHAKKLLPAPAQAPVKRGKVQHHPKPAQQHTPPAVHTFVPKTSGSPNHSMVLNYSPGTHQPPHTLGKARINGVRLA